MNKKLTTSFISLATGTALLASLVTPVFAVSVTGDADVSASVNTSGVTGNASVSGSQSSEMRDKNHLSSSFSASSTTAERAQKVEHRMSKAVERGDKEIDRRITALESLSAKINGMTKLSDSDKATLSSQLQTQISAMTALKAKIDADTDATVLKTDIKSITTSYRIFALVIPEGKILVAVDRMGALADKIAAIGVKLQARITAAATAGKDVSALQTALADLNAKVADAKVQYQAAESETASLHPDQGNEATFQANKKVLLDARAKIKAGKADLEAARKDAKTIVKGLKAFHLEATASTTASTSVSH